MQNPIGWFEIYVDDLQRAKAFYESVFAVSLESLTPPDTGEDVPLKMLAFPSDMDAYGASGALVQVEGMQAGGNSTLVYFSCEDCAVEGSRVAEAGGRVEREKMAIGEYGFIVLAFDSEGNMIGLHSHR
ncbi:VOC family protein [Alteromonas halophila]|uniref:Glyoxalase n=1 Tax=Alteromonas halophila TaxID=516698 RepID=A0A918JR96_9ALTE|nr:VOC family protein [Alteromonas halophila]GGW94928.1 glyoxalase [Alteromonas halophila]